MPPQRKLILALTSGAALIAASIAVASSAVGTTPYAADAASASKTRSTAQGFHKAKWGSNMTVTYGSATVRIKSNGLPLYGYVSHYALPNTGVQVPTASTAHIRANPTKSQTYDYTLTTRPTYTANTTATSLGPIGIMIDGATLFNPYEGDSRTVALASNFYLTSSQGTKVYFIDACNGHPTPTGMYHYHGLPRCIVKHVDTPKGRSHILGVAFDGFPIYGDRDIHGKPITASQLDKCNGIFSATSEYPHGIYHYVLLNAPNVHSSLSCLHGKLSTSSLPTTGGMGPMPGMGAGGPPAAAK